MRAYAYAHVNARVAARARRGKRWSLTGDASGDMGSSRYFIFSSRDA
jgi:hypothetical protein